MKILALMSLMSILAPSAFASKFDPSQWVGTYHTDFAKSDSVCDSDLETVSFSDNTLYLSNDPTDPSGNDSANAKGVSAVFPQINEPKQKNVKNSEWIGPSTETTKTTAGSHSIHFKRTGADSILLNLDKATIVDDSMNRNDDGSLDLTLKRLNKQGDQIQWHCHLTSSSVSSSK